MKVYGISVVMRARTSQRFERNESVKFFANTFLPFETFERSDLERLVRELDLG